MEGRVVEHFRLDVSKGLWIALGPASLLVLIGAVLVGAAMVSQRVEALSRGVPVPVRTRQVATPVDRMGAPIPQPAPPYWLVGLGLGSVVVGGAAAILGLRRALKEESYLVLRTDGALFQHRGERVFLAWSEVEAVRFDPGRRAIVFERHDGTSVARPERFAGIQGDEIARRAAAVRRKAIFNLPIT